MDRASQELIHYLNQTIENMIERKFRQMFPDGAPTRVARTVFRRKSNGETRRLILAALNETKYSMSAKEITKHIEHEMGIPNFPFATIQPAVSRMLNAGELTRIDAPGAAYRVTVTGSSLTLPPESLTGIPEYPPNTLPGFPAFDPPDVGLPKMPKQAK